MAYNCSGIYDHLLLSHPEKGLMEIYHQHPKEFDKLAQKKGRLLTETNEWERIQERPFVDMGNFRDILSPHQYQTVWLINHVSLEITNPFINDPTDSQVVYKDIDVPAEIVKANPRMKLEGYVVTDKPFAEANLSR
ncbi:hypothetical protein SPFM8_00100 [Salmonella phage SPFM8]|nr:hypothetical protein SPFM8_00100 [Salmonella phage SPFM8]